MRHKNLLISAVVGAALAVAADHVAPRATASAGLTLWSGGGGREWACEDRCEPLIPPPPPALPGCPPTSACVHVMGFNCYRWTNVSSHVCVPGVLFESCETDLPGDAVETCAKQFKDSDCDPTVPDSFDCLEPQPGCGVRWSCTGS